MLREGNVFTRVCLFIGGTMWPLPMMHWTSLYSPPLGSVPSYWTWDLIVQGSPGPGPVAFGGHHWRPVQTYSPQDPPHPLWHWHLVMAVEARMVIASGRYASNWNACLLLIAIIKLSLNALLILLSHQLGSVKIIRETKLKLNVAKELHTLTRSNTMLLPSDS